MPRSREPVVGLLATEGLPAELARNGAEEVPEKLLERQVGHGVGFDAYVRLAWLVSALATVGGALDSFVESDDAVREATYRYLPEDDDAPEPAS